MRLPDQHANSRAARSGFLQALHFAHAHAGGKFLAFGDGAFGVGRAAGERALHGIGGHLFQIASLLPFPPRSCGRSSRSECPTPTGTLCPSLPHTPMPSSSFRSLPTMLTYFSASGPLPISDAPRTGRVSLPSSIR